MSRTRRCADRNAPTVDLAKLRRNTLERWHPAGGTSMLVRQSRTMGTLFAVHHVGVRGIVSGGAWEVWMGANRIGTFATLYLAKEDADTFERQMAELMARLTAADRAPAEDVQQRRAT